MSRIFFLFACMALAACGQTGALYLPPTCSPMNADGTVRTLTDEDGNVLPPCPPPELDEFAAPEEGTQDETEEDVMSQDY